MACDVGVADRLHLVDPVLLRDVVEGAEELADEPDHLLSAYLSSVSCSDISVLCYLCVCLFIYVCC